MSDINQIEKDLQLAIYDPNLIQVKSLLLLDNMLDGNGEIPDPNNPFIFLLENNALVTSSAIKEVSVAMRKSYPELATTNDDLYGFINTTEINDIFATSSTAKFNLFIRLDDIQNFGYNNGIFSKVTIPKFSNIVVDNIPFTILNDIIINVYEDGKVFSMYKYNDIDISLNSDTILESGLVKDSEDVTWVLVSLDIPQVKKYSFKENVFTSNVFKTDIVIDETDFYSYTTITTKDPKTKNNITLDVTYSNFVYNPDKPTMIIRPNGKKINFELPFVYNVNNLIDKYLTFTLFTTRGKIEIPLNKYETSDFTFNVEMPTTTDESIIGLQNITIKINSNSYTYGGKNEVTFKELKDKVLNYSTGDNSIPITTSEIKSQAIKYGFIFNKHLNKITNTVALLTKYIDKLNYDVHVKMDVINSNITLAVKNDTAKIKIYKNDSVIIEPFQLFEKTGNSINPLSTIEQNNIADLVNTNINEYNKHNVFFNLYKYILDYNDIVTSRVYDVNQPTISNTNSINTVLNENFPIIITDRLIYNKGSYYEVNLIIKSNNDVDSLDVEKTFCQLIFNIGISDNLYLLGDLVRDSKTNDLKVIVEIKNDSYIDSNNMMNIESNIENNVNNLLHSGSVNLITNCTMTIYSIDTSLNNINNTKVDEVLTHKATAILYEETFDIKLGTYLENLFTSYTVTYTNRKFVTYTENIFKYHNKDVYELDETGTIKLIPVDTNNDNVYDDVMMNKIHTKGDVMLDGDDNPIILHRKGDIKLDDNDKPIVDPNVGVLHNINLLLLEDKFIRATNITYSDYRIDLFLKLTNIITNEIGNIKNEVLENTDVLYTPSTDLSNVVLINNNIPKTYPNNISPTITVYTADESFVISSILEDKMFNILQDNIIKNININDVEKLIMKELPDTALSVKISNIISDELVILNYAPESSKFFINKRLSKNSDGENIVVPDISIILIKI